jgi:hydroxymethylbilane synthase
VGISEVVFTVM